MVGRGDRGVGQVFCPQHVVDSQHFLECLDERKLADHVGCEKAGSCRRRNYFCCLLCIGRRAMGMESNSIGNDLEFLYGFLLVESFDAGDCMFFDVGNVSP